MNENLFNISSSPHVRSKLTTGNVMFDVVLCLLPAALFGVYHFGLHALLVIVAAIAATVLTELIYDKIAKKPMTITDGSAVVTGLLLALSLSHSVPLYVPVLGGIFAILFVKCFFGGLGKNFMNPALAARCFLLISFGTSMTSFAVDGVSSATPLGALRAGDAVNVAQVYLGFSNSVIGGSALALILGGLLLWVMGGITFEIPAACLVAFTAFMALFGGQGFNVPFLLTNICAGGILMGAFFMATDPVTSPVTSNGQLIFGAIVGILAGLFRVKGASADSVSYAIILSNLFVPFIDKYIIPKPLGYRPGDGVVTKDAAKKTAIPKAAVNLCVITLFAGLALSAVFALTKDKIAEQKMAANAASYKEVCPDAETFAYDDALTAAMDALGGEPYDTSKYGRTYINEVVVGKAADGSVAGYVISASSAEGFDGTITISIGFNPDGVINGIAFTELNETAGMGMKCGDEPFKSQFNGVEADQLTLNKAGGSTTPSDINSVSGASVSSGAVVNTVNTALAFFAANVK